MQGRVAVNFLRMILGVGGGVFACKLLEFARDEMVVGALKIITFPS